MRWRKPAKAWSLSTTCPLAFLRSCPKDRKSTRLNSSHLVISYAVFCLKKKKNNLIDRTGKKKQARYQYNESRLSSIRIDKHFAHHSISLIPTDYHSLPHTDALQYLTTD